MKDAAVDLENLIDKSIQDEGSESSKYDKPEYYSDSSPAQ